MLLKGHLADGFTAFVVLRPPPSPLLLLERSVGWTAHHQARNDAFRYVSLSFCVSLDNVLSRRPILTVCTLGNESTQNIIFSTWVQRKFDVTRTRGTNQRKVSPFPPGFKGLLTSHEHRNTIDTTHSPAEQVDLQTDCYTARARPQQAVGHGFPKRALKLLSVAM